MKCLKKAELFTWICNECDAGERNRVAAHLERCPRCRGSLESLQSEIAVLQGKMAILEPTGEPRFDFVLRLPRRRDRHPLRFLAALEPILIPRRKSVVLASGALLLLLGLAGMIAFGGRWRVERPDLARVEAPLADASQVRLQSARIENEAAKVFLFQSRSRDRAIFFIKKERSRS